MATLLSPFIVPASSIGDNYLIVMGVIEQKNPTQTPWIERPRKRVTWFGIRTRIPAKIAAELQIMKFWLDYEKFLLSGIFLDKVFCHKGT